jgi:hypothetical protein
MYSTIERKEKRQSLPPRSARCTIRPLWRQKMAGSGAHRNYASLFATLCATGSVQAADFLERPTHRGRLRGGRRERSTGSRPLGAQSRPNGRLLPLCAHRQRLGRDAGWIYLSRALRRDRGLSLAAANQQLHSVGHVGGHVDRFRHRLPVRHFHCRPVPGAARGSCRRRKARHFADSRIEASRRQSARSGAGDFCADGAKLRHHGGLSGQVLRAAHGEPSNWSSKTPARRRPSENF